MPAEPSSRPRALSVAATAHAVQDGLTSTVYVLLPLLAQGFGLSYAQVGLLKGAMSGTQSALEFGSGWLSERAGEARLIGVGLVLSGLGYALMSAAPGVGAIAASFLVIGSGTALHHAPGSALVAGHAAPGRRGRALGLFNASGDLGKLAFTGAVSLLTGLGLAWAQITAAYAALTLCAAAFVLLSARAALSPVAQRRNRSERQAAAAMPRWGITDRRGFAALVVASGLDTALQTTVLVFIAFLMLEAGLSLPMATTAPVLILAGGVVGKAAGGALADALGAARAFASIQAATAAGLVALTLAPGWLALGLLVPLGAVLQGSSTITYAAAPPLIHPERVASGYALLYAAGSGAAALGPLALGAFADTAGVAPAFGVLALLTLLTVPPFLWMRRAASVSAGG